MLVEVRAKIIAYYQYRVLFVKVVYLGEENLQDLSLRNLIIIKVKIRFADFHRSFHLTVEVIEIVSELKLLTLLEYGFIVLLQLSI